MNSLYVQIMGQTYGSIIVSKNATPELEIAISKSPS